MNNEILNERQAIQIITSYNDIIISLNHKLDSAANAFYESVRAVWEDDLAVRFFDEWREGLCGINNCLNVSMRTFSDRVSNAAQLYLNVGKSGKRFVAPSVSLGALQIAGKKLSSAFPNGEFGFKNVSSPEDVVNAVTTLEKTAYALSEEAIRKINSINAFGNTEVSRGLSSSAGRIIDDIERKIAGSRLSAFSSLQKAKQQYAHAGTNAAGIASGQ